MADTIILRKAAKAQGLRHYFTGMPCLRRHVEKRFVSNKECIKCGRLRHARWSAKNPERNREIDRRSRAKNRIARNRRRRQQRRNDPKIIAAERKWITENRERYLARKRKWREANRDKGRRYAREHRARQHKR